MQFLSRYRLFFKKLWTVPWFYFLLALLAAGNHVWGMKILIGIVLAVVFPLLGMGYDWYVRKHLRKDDKKGA